MSYNAEILADSINPQGDRITTMKITFPRMVLAEFNTHRMFSRNSASSRAIPFKKMVKMVEDNPFIPIAWQKDHKGMQGTEYIKDTSILIDDWINASKSAIQHAEDLNESTEGYGVTKQLCNRLLEPFMWHTVIVTATEWENFFKLRCPDYIIEDSVNGNQHFRSKKDLLKVFKDADEAYSTIEDWLSINKSQADIHIQAIAELMWDAMNESTPKELKAGEWHIPYGDDGNAKILNTTDLKVKIATARCARISYQTLGENPKTDYEADIRLHDILTSNGHASPLEHIAKAMTKDEYESDFMRIEGNNITLQESGVVDYSKAEGWCRNFKGFIQYRHIMGL